MSPNQSFIAAVRNVARHGDTDIFPFPFENLLFSEFENEAVFFLETIHKDFGSWLAAYPPQSVSALTQVGYTGFRWATLIDPFWNAYYLSLVIQVASQIESVRIPETDATVFSYRFHWQDSEAKLFKDSTWIDFRKRCLELSKSYPIVIQTDISDFYPRIYHHRVENGLQRLPNPGDLPKRIMDLLGVFSKNVSYGLPIGGPASRILAELSLNGVDTMLKRKAIQFCRYADDYTIFCSDKAEAYRTLVFLCEQLANEGLVLQKKKTRIIDAEEFAETAQLLDPVHVADTLASEEQKLLGISIQFDPYSPTAVEDYEDLKEAVSHVDVIGILGREIAKTNIDSSVAKQAIQALTALEPNQQQQAMLMLLNPQNIMTLAPVFVTVMRVIRGLYPKFQKEFQNIVDDQLCSLYVSRSPVLAVEVNLSYYLQALAGNLTQRKEEIVIQVHDSSKNPLIRRLVILMMGRWRCHYWLTDVKNAYGAMSIFEKRAFIVASYSMGDEGKHWRDYTKPTWQPPELLVRDWYSARLQKGGTIVL